MFDLKSLVVRLGLKKAKIFGEEPPYPNPNGYPTNPAGIPLVPEEDVKKGGLMNMKTVFDGACIYGGVSGEDRFQIRTEFEAPKLREGDMFAFDNQRPNGPPLVFQVTEVESSSFSGAYMVDTQHVGYLNTDHPETAETVEEAEKIKQTA